MIHWIALSSSLLSTALGQVLFKFFFQSKNNFHLGLAIAFLVSIPFTSYIALRQLDIGLVYMSTAISQVLILGLSRYLLKEKLTKDHFIAMLLIIVGVTLYSYNPQ